MASIYALACTSSGNVVVSGSPDKIIRVWDSRQSTKKQLPFKFRGHTDAIRSLILSEDGRWLLSGSSDSTIKLWDLTQPNQVLWTYTHYQDSVCCLHGDDSPSLDTFWAGSRDGWVTKCKKINTADGNPVDIIGICKEDASITSVSFLLFFLNSNILDCCYS